MRGISQDHPRKPEITQESAFLTIQLDPGPKTAGYQPTVANVGSIRCLDHLDM